MDGVGVIGGDLEIRGDTERTGQNWGVGIGCKGVGCPPREEGNGQGLCSEKFRAGLAG